jgi:hypothetical protein
VIALFIFFILIVGMVFLMLKSPDFANAVGIVIAVLVALMVFALLAASCS